MPTSPELTTAIDRLLKGANSAVQKLAQQALAHQGMTAAHLTHLATKMPLAQLTAPLLDAEQRWQAFAQANEAGLAAFAAQAVSFQDRVREFLRYDSVAIIEAFKQLPAKTQAALLQLAHHGWYLDPQMGLSDLTELAEALANGDTQEVEDALVAYYEHRMSDIEASLIAKLPARAHLIQMALGAHRREEYALTIPVLLAQADGACTEIFSESFFLKKDKLPSTAPFVATMTAHDAFLGALLSPLGAALPIAASERDRGPHFKGLNRHMVLHGESLDYGTRANSLRALSLLHYVTHVWDGQLPPAPAPVTPK